MGCVIVITSGKGGTGKTSLTGGLGTALALQGHKVLCIDGDVGLRNLDITLGMTDAALMDFSDVIAGRCPLGRAVAPHPSVSGLYLLTAPLTLPEDFPGDGPLAGIAFQRELEARAYAAGRPGGEYAAPAENIQSFLEGRGRLNIGCVQPTYDRGVVAADLGALLPTELADTLRAGLRAYERKIAGYTAPEAILTGLETRTSSPVRLKREENFECAQLAGLYPCGEGAGYAGGIMSAAVDGLRVARAIISRYSPAEG